MIHRFVIKDADQLPVTLWDELHGPSLALNARIALEATWDGFVLVLYLDDTGLAPEIVEAIRAQVEGNGP